MGQARGRASSCFLKGSFFFCFVLFSAVFWAAPKLTERLEEAKMNFNLSAWEIGISLSYTKKTLIRPIFATTLVYQKTAITDLSLPDINMRPQGTPGRCGERRTPSGPTLAARLREASGLYRVDVT